MKRLAIAALVAGCMSPAPGTLKPDVFVVDWRSRVTASVQFEGDPDLDADATFRGTTSAMTKVGAGAYSVGFDLDQPLAADEPMTIDVDGIAMTITAPPAFDNVVVPQFISRSHTGTISWTTTSSDPMSWNASGCGTGNGEIAPGASSITFMPSDWKDGGGTSTCKDDVVLQRGRVGTVDPAFAGGSIAFDQTFVAVFASMP